MKNNLEAMRTKMNWSQKELGERLKVSRQTVISIEKGKYNPSLELAFKIAALFEVKIEDIFIYKEE